MKLRRGLNINIQKAYTEGIYTDNSLNRKLGRVGMKYGINVDSFEEKEDKQEDIFSVDSKVILKQAKNTLSERGSEFIEDIIKNDDFDRGSLYTSEGKIHLNMPIEVDPITNFDYVNLGKRTEESIRESNNKYCKFLEETYNKEKLTKRLSVSYKEEGKSYTHYSILDNLAYKHEQMNYLIDDAKRTIYYNELGNKYGYEDDYDEVISDEEAERYILTKGSKIQKENFRYVSQEKKLIAFLKENGFDFEGKSQGDMSQEEGKKFIELIINSSRKDFYGILKSSISNDSNYSDALLRTRFLFRYNKYLAGSGWHDVKNEENKIDIKKRDDIIALAEQIEYTIDDVLKDDKSLFINNPNIKFLYYDTGLSWGGASYNASDKMITITDEYFQILKNRKYNKNASTLSREKFLVEGLIHEIGHSTDITSDIYESEAYKDFALHLGYDKNRLYTIYANAIKDTKDAMSIRSADYYINIKKDKKKEIENKFKDLFLDIEKDKEVQEFWDNSQFSKIFISDYSNKSVCEGYAEYFSFYIGNKAKIDKDITEYKKNPDKFIKNKDIKDWYRYSVYNQKWKDWIDKSDTSDEKEKRNKYYQKVLKHNMEMLIDMQKIVKLLKDKY